MRVLRWAALPAAAMAVALALLPQCAPEELVYAPSGGAPGDGSAGTGGAAGSGTGGGGIGGTATWPEVCGNGIDDDENGKTDCEDPSCPDLACVDLPPSGWSGPVALYTGPTGTLPECPKGLENAYSGHADVEYTPATCGSCSCGSPTSSSCSVTASYFSDVACLVSAGALSVSSACTPGPAGTVAGVKVTATPNGSCGAGTAATPSVTPPTWKTDVRACALAVGKPAGCAGGKVCAPLFAQSLACVYQAGDVQCPAGFPTRSVYFGDFEDTRTCSACSCSFSASGCSVNVNGYQDTACTTPTFSGLSPGSACAAGDTHAARVTSATATGTSCTPGASSPSGCVAPNQPTTFCCSGGTACPSGGGPEMVQVPAPGGGTYCIDSTEVTRKQYGAFIAANPSTAGQPASCAWNTSFSSFGGGFTDDRPVTNVDWCDAYAFCAWAGKRLCGKIGGGALPVSSATSASESQWYNACSAGGSKKYPYGPVLVSGNCATNGSSPVKSRPCCVGGYPGLFDLSGSVDEWEDSCDVQSSDGKKDNCSLRGQSACDQPNDDNRDQRASDIGFRCCAP